ncbi:MAG: DinB family protein [Bacteroidota bacterium]
MSATTIGTILQDVILKAKPQLLALSEAETSNKPSPEKWSKKQMLGHLVDSAANNHQRFVRIQHQDQLIFPGYEQAKWVEQQQYQEADWEMLVEFWTLYNLHLGRVISLIPDELFYKVFEPNDHNLHSIAMRTVGRGEGSNLAYFAYDYVSHLEHHLTGLIPNYQSQTPTFTNPILP